MMLTGKHLIAGTWVASAATFQSFPATGEAQTFSAGTPADVDAAVKGAEAALPSYSALSPEARAIFLEKIADEIEARGAELTATAMAESGLPAARLEGERGRTTGQLRLFAAHIRKGEYLDRRHDAALPDRKPAPRPDIKMVQRPIGRRLELSAGLLDRRRRHRLGAGRRLHRGRQRAPGASRHGGTGRSGD
jgi:NADP-dependent aldehyde dehydrogenase